MYTYKLQALQASITWKECAELPNGLRNAKTIVINGKVYCGGGEANDGDDDGDDDANDEFVVYCYDPSQDKWTTLPPLPVRHFGLGQVNGKLVAVGGEMRGCYAGETNKVDTYDERSQKWKQTIPPMPTATSSMTILSLQSLLIMAGGSTPSSYYTNAVEIFKPDLSQWYRTDPLPKACTDIYQVADGNTCYALGGYSSSHLNQALFASVDDLLSNAVPANRRPIHRSSSDTKSAWKTLPNTPTYEPAAAVLAGNLLAIGGYEASFHGPAKKEVYMYSPSTNSWIYVSDLPKPRALTAVAALSSNEILVIGGVSDGKRVNSTYKGTFTLSLK